MLVLCSSKAIHHEALTSHTSEPAEFQLQDYREDARFDLLLIAFSTLLIFFLLVFN
jgi:hypothetical protein